MRRQDRHFWFMFLCFMAMFVLWLIAHSQECS